MSNNEFQKADKTFISEMLACAYASHVAACEANGVDAVSSQRFFELYDSNRETMYKYIGVEIPNYTGI